MKLKELLACIPGAEVTGDDAVEISSLCYDSRQVVPGAAFFAATTLTFASSAPETLTS